MNIASLLERSAKRYPERPALLHGARVLHHYGELRARVAALAAHLREACAVAPGDRVAIYSANAPEGTDAVPEQPPAPLPEVAALLTKGACASCHGANFTKPIDPAYPKLAGQHADYLYAALKSYQIENKPVVGRVHAIMGPQTKPFSHVELKAISNYIGSLPGEMATVPEPRFR